MHVEKRVPSLKSWVKFAILATSPPKGKTRIDARCVTPHEIKFDVVQGCGEGTGENIRDRY